MAVAIPEWIAEQFPSKQTTANAVVSQRLVAVERNKGIASEFGHQPESCLRSLALG